MESHHIVGFALIGAGLMDAILVPVMRRRIADERQRALVSTALLCGAGLMVALGAMFLTGIVSLGG
jgi:hypothetical protein